MCFSQAILASFRSKLMVIDLGSLLIKPVQRVLKYPLLLRELLKTTPQPMPGEDASYYQEIVEATKIAENISKEINQAKRAFDLGRYVVSVSFELGIFQAPTSLYLTAQLSLFECLDDRLMLV